MKHKRYLVYKANYVVSFKKRHCCAFWARKEDLTARLRRRRIIILVFLLTENVTTDLGHFFFFIFAIDYLPIVWVLQFPGRRARLSRSCPPRGSAVKCTFCILKERNKSNVLE